MIYVTKKLSDGRYRVVDSDDGVEEYVSESMFNEAVSMGIRVFRCFDSAVDFGGNYAFLLLLQRESNNCRVAVVDNKSAHVLCTDYVSLDFGNNRRPYIDRDEIAVSAYKLPHHDNHVVLLSIHDKHYYMEDRSETFKFDLEYDVKCRKLIKKSKIWSRGY